MSDNSNDQNLFLRSIEQEKAGLDFEFYWQNIDQILEQVQSECQEVKEAFLEKDEAHLKEEIGDLISATLFLSIYLNFDPEELLKNSIEKYQKRYNKLVELVKADGLDNLKNQPLKVLMDYWNKAKKGVMD